VHGALEHPAIFHVLALQVLEEMPVIGVCRGIALLVRPCLIARDVEGHVELGSEHGLRQDRHALLREVRANFVYGSQRWGHRVHVTKVRATLGNAWVRRERGALRWRIGKLHLPAEGHPVRGILSEEIEENRRPCSWKSDDEEWPLDWRARNLGVSCAVPVDAEPILKKPEQRLTAHHPPKPSQICLTRDGVEEHGKRITEALIAEVVGLGCACRSANDVVGVQGRPSGGQHGAHAVEHPHGAVSMRRRCSHGVALRRVARASIARKTWSTHE
jgi:hypothetical protein